MNADVWEASRCWPITSTARRRSTRILAPASASGPASFGFCKWAHWQLDLPLLLGRVHNTSRVQNTKQGLLLWLRDDNVPIHPRSPASLPSPPLIPLCLGSLFFGPFSHASSWLQGCVFQHMFWHMLLVWLLPASFTGMTKTLLVRVLYMYTACHTRTILPAESPMSQVLGFRDSYITLIDKYHMQWPWYLLYK